MYISLFINKESKTDYLVKLNYKRVLFEFNNTQIRLKYISADKSI